MSEEEKKAIEDLKKLKIGIGILNNFIDEKDRDETDIKAIDIILNLIERQQKELEQEKEKNKNIENVDLLAVYLDAVYDCEKKWKDKIRAKIEELQCDNDNYENYAIRRAYKELLEE